MFELEEAIKVKVKVSLILFSTTMSDTESDPLLLFTPVKGSSSSHQEPPNTPVPKSTPSHPAFWINPPSIPFAEKRMYKTGVESGLKDEVEIEVIK